MTERYLTILSCGSAKPTAGNTPSAQLLRMRDKEFLIDCGEGAQLTMAKMGLLPPHRMGHIFISHLHGDHCHGLIGLISTLGMLHRTADLHIHAPAPVKEIFQPQLDFFCKDNTFKVIFDEFSTRRSQVIYDDNSLTVSTIPLKHTVPCCGFLFQEKPSLRHYLREIGDAYGISPAYIPAIKQGADYTMPDGTIIPNRQLTSDPTPPFRYAYCSDTAYKETIIPIIENVDCLYHEATFLTEHEQRAKTTGHSTAHQAAMIAQKANVKKLIIGHFSSRYNDTKPLLKEAQEVFPDTILATPQTKIEF